MLNLFFRVAVILLVCTIQPQLKAYAAFIPQNERSEIDSLLSILPLSNDSEKVHILFALSKKYLSYSLDSSGEYARLALQNAKETNNKRAIAKAFKLLGNINLYIGNNKEVIQYYDSSLQVYILINDSNSIAKIWNNLGVVYNDIGEYKKSIEYYIKSLKHKISINDSMGISNTYNNIGSIYYDLEEYDKAFEQFAKSLEISRAIDNQHSIQNTLNNIGLIMQEQGEFVESLEYFNESLSIGEEINNKIGLANTFHNIGRSKFELGSYTEALDYYLKALELYNLLGVKSSQTLNNIGQLYIELDYYKQGQKYLYKALDIAIQNNQFEILRKIYDNLSVSCEFTGDFKKAHEYYVLFDIYDDSVKNQTFLNRIDEINSKFEIENQKRDFEKRSLETQLELEKKDSKIERKNIVIYSVVAGLLGIFIFSMILLKLFKEKSKSNKLLVSQNDQVLRSDKVIKKINKALKENEEMLRSIFDASPYAIFVVDNNGKIIDCNPAGMDMFNVKQRKELINKNYFGLFSEKSKSLANKDFDEAIKSGTVKVNQYMLCRPDGTRFSAEINGGLINGSPGNPKAFVAIISDITERLDFIGNLKSAKKEAEESNKLKTSFLANMSHEIRTPMNAIVGFSNLLSEQSIDSKNKEEYLNHIIQSSNTLLNLIDDIIDMSKIESNQLNINLKESRINPVLIEVFERFKSANHNENLELGLNIPENSDNYVLNADWSRFRQILTNLIANAIKFTNEGTIEIGYSVIEKEDLPVVEFFVKDTGIGIPENKLDAIFDQFRQLDDSLARKFGGTGLGLAITKHLVELSGGQIYVKSQLGIGSEFYFYFPFKPGDVIKTERRKPQKTSERTWEKKTILIAEDENSNFEMIKASIQKTGVKTIRAHNGEEAVEIIKSHSNIDLVLMDVRMPKLNGYDATRQIKSLNKNIPVIAITAYAMSEDESKSLGAGCDKYIAKPIRPAKLISIIEDYI